MKILGFEIRRTATVEAEKSEMRSTLLSSSFWRQIFAGSVSAGVEVNEDRLLGITAFWAAVRVVANSISTLPASVVRSDGESSERLWLHPVSRLLRGSVSPIMTRFSFFQGLLANAMLGNGYAVIHRDPMTNRALWLELVPFDRVSVVEDGFGGLVYDVAFWDNRGSALVPWTDMIHLKGLSLDGMIGRRTVAVHQSTIGSALASQDYTSGYFANGAHPSAVMAYNGSLPEDDKIKLATKISKGYGKMENAGKVMVLDNTQTFTPVQANPVEAALIEFRQLSVQDVSRMTGVPPHLLADLLRSTNATIFQQSTELVLYCLAPWCQALQEELSLKLLTSVEIEDGLAFQFDYSRLLIGDSASQAEFARTVIQNGVLDADEVREYLGFQKVRGKDKRLIQLNMTRLELVQTAVGDPLHTEKNPADRVASVNSGGE